jgi:glycosyltransferase involved in cell wall biosynthesis
VKILSVNNTADLYGASRCLERVLGRFAETGHEVHVVLPEPGPLSNLLEARGIMVHVHRGLPVIDRTQLRQTLSALRFFLLLPYSVLWLAVLIIRFRIDLVHTNTVVTPTPSVAALITGTRHVWHVRELLGEFGFLWRPYQRFVHLLSYAIVAISSCIRDQFDPSLRSKIRVIYDGLDVATPTVDPIRAQAFRETFHPATLLVGVVGRIKWHRKGQEILVRAAALLCHKYPQAHFVIVGSPSPGNEDHEVRLRELISDLCLDRYITLLGETEDPASVFAALDIAVAPSVQPEPFGCVVIEAMASYTPVVGSRCGGIAEQIVDGVTGFLFPPADFAALACALDQLLGDPALREHMADEGYRRVRTTFPLEKTYREMAVIFEQTTNANLDVAIGRTR